MQTVQPERTLLTAAGCCPRSRCATPPAPNQNSDNSADAQRLRAPPPACWGAPAVPSGGQPVAGPSAGFGWRDGPRGGAAACRVDTIAEHSLERCARRAPHRADVVRRLLRPPWARPKLRSPHRPSLTSARRCSGTGRMRWTAHGGTGEQSRTRRRSAPPSPSTCLSRLSSGGLAGAARVGAGDAQRPSLLRFAPAPSPLSAPRI